MKKCIQCTKDLPDAALHCVFCGSKQPAQAPPEVARTVMGYSANQVREQVGAAPLPAEPPRRPGPSAPPPLPGTPAATSAPAAFAATAFVPPASPPRAPMPPTPAPPMPGPAYNPAPAPSASPPGFAAPAPAGFAAPAPAGFAAPAPAGFAAPAPAGFAAPAPAYAPPGVPSAPPGGASLAPASNANAATMFVPSSSPQPPSLAGSSPAPTAASAPTAYMPQPSPQPPALQPPQPSPQPALQMPPAYASAGAHSPYAGYAAPGVPPYLASQTAARAGRPVDPYRDGLRLVLFAFGILLVGAFCTPLSSAPSFHWDILLAEGPVAAKLPALFMAVVGVMAIVLASLPLPSAPRGLLAGVFALAAIATPLLLVIIDSGSVGGWRSLVLFAAPLLLVPGLLLRQEYREHVLPRLMVTIAVLALLATLLVPQGGQLPLVSLAKQLLDLPGKAKLGAVLELVWVLLVVLSLLVWLPAPSSGAGKALAWLFIFWPAVQHFQGLILSEGMGEAIKQAPYASAMVWAPAAAYAAILGYGFATALGKALEPQ